MSHFPLRTEKNCLNCGTTVLGRYCQECGQENLEPKETFWHLVTHFIEDITHFDGKFFMTLKLLLFRPGFLSGEYVRGRRMSYLHPIRMYVFTSFIFFFILYSIIGSGSHKYTNSTQKKSAELYATQARLQKELFTVSDSSRRKEIQDSLKEAVYAINAFNTARLFIDSSGKGATKINFNATGLGGERLPATVEEYDSIQQHTPPSKRQPWLYRMVNRRAVELSVEFHEDKKHFETEVWEGIQHTFPKILFVSLPLFALLLRLLNLRRRKEILYVDHGIFTIHLYCATFIIMLAIMLVSELSDWLHWKWMDWLIWVLIIGAFVYEYKAMRGFYKQGRGKTFLKFFLLNTASIVLITILTTLFTFWAIFQV